MFQGFLNLLLSVIFFFTAFHTAAHPENFTYPQALLFVQILAAVCWLVGGMIHIMRAIIERDYAK